MAASSRPRPSLVTKLEPTLTTMRRASRKTVDVKGWLMVLNVSQMQKIQVAESIRGEVPQQNADQYRPVLALEFAAL